MARATFKAPTYKSEIEALDAAIKRLDPVRWPTRIANHELEIAAYELDRQFKGKPYSATIRVHQLCDEAKDMMRRAEVCIL